MSEQWRQGSPLVVGVDLDNTIVVYDELMHELALERGLISREVGTNKREVRDTIRRLPDGEIHWQQLQGSAYGPRMKEASLSEGAGNFFQACQRRKVKIFIVSHKTELANYDETQTNLRQSAIAWMTGVGFFCTPGFGLRQEDVFFEDTRQEKLRRIQSLDCTHFIDDLKEVFGEEGFPSNVRKILYAPSQAHSCLRDAELVGGWDEITAYFFGAQNVN